jgi:predicted enzyme related to lactoylglutathione lyase
MNTVGYFEIQSSNPDRDIAFYTTVFGWKFLRENNIPIPYYRIESAGITGALLMRPAKTPDMGQGTNAFTCSMEVSDFDEAAKKILDNGGREAMPKFAVPGKCWQGYFIDPDNNTFGIFEVDENAA